MGIWLNLNALLYSKVAFNSDQLMGPANRFKKGAA